jgi:outer membrane cobalamin receptor
MFEGNILTFNPGIDADGEEFYFSGNRDIRQYGLETGLRAPGLWRDQLFFFGSFTWMHSEENVDGHYSKYREIPSLNLTAGVQMEVGIWDASLTLKHVDDYQNFRFAQDGGYHDLGDYLDITLSGGVRIGRDRNIRLYALIDNALDDTYSTVVGWNDPGRRFRVGLESTF